MRRRLVIIETEKAKCCSCGRCYHLIDGWPDKHPQGLTVGTWAVEANQAVFDRVVASCPFELIKLEAA